MTNQINELLLFPDMIHYSIGYSMHTPELRPGMIDFILAVHLETLPRRYFAFRAGTNSTVFEVCKASNFKGRKGTLLR